MGGEHACSQPRPQALLCVCACAEEARTHAGMCLGWAAGQERTGEGGVHQMHPCKCADAACACMRACMHGVCTRTHTPHHQLRGWCARQHRHGHSSQWHRQAGQAVGSGANAPCWGVGWRACWGRQGKRWQVLGVPGDCSMLY